MVRVDKVEESRKSKERRVVAHLVLLWLAGSLVRLLLGSCHCKLLFCLTCSIRKETESRVCPAKKMREGCGRDAAAEAAAAPSSQLRNLKEKRGRRGETVDPSRPCICEACARRKGGRTAARCGHTEQAPLRRSHILPLAAARLRGGSAALERRVCSAMLLFGRI